MMNALAQALPPGVSPLAALFARGMPQVPNAAMPAMMHRPAALMGRGGGILAMLQNRQAPNMAARFQGLGGFSGGGMPPAFGMSSAHGKAY